jgi:hypothetical protein
MNAARVIDFDSYVQPEQVPLAAVNDNSRGPFITTFTGRFHPFSPRASEVNIYDIAHALSMQCRYSGHGERFYSVAEHSVLVAREVLDNTGSKSEALASLLHDAPEALSGFGDIASPVKSRVPFIMQVEARIFGAIAAYAGIAPIIPPIVHEVDRRITADEMASNLHECPVLHEPLGIELQYWSSAVAEAEFLRMWNRLGGGDAL